MILSIYTDIAMILASIITVFLILVGISMFTNIKVPIIDYSVSTIISKYYIRKTRRKNNLITSNWNLKSFDLDKQDIKFELLVDGELEAKLRIVYCKNKETFFAFQSRWNYKKDVLEETEVDGEPQYLMKLFGIPRRMYEIIHPGCACHKKITGGVSHPIISMPTRIKVK